MEFSQPLAPAKGQPLLIVDGWVEFPYSQTAFAAWQAGQRFQSPTLEAQGADGTWRIVHREFGYPGGMPRQMSVPLGELPDGTTRLRLRTNQEVYWDRLAVAFAEPCPQATRQTLELHSARVQESGFMPRIVHQQQRPDFIYADRVPLAGTQDPAGFYTEFGPASELVSVADNAVAIFGPGEEIHLEFAAPPPDAGGRTRRIVLEAVGWCKDMDLYTADGATVAPLPTRGPSALNAQYNTRYQVGW
jgi:hypothetical protein